MNARSADCLGRTPPPTMFAPDAHIFTALPAMSGSSSILRPGVLFALNMCLLQRSTEVDVGRRGAAESQMVEAASAQPPWYINTRASSTAQTSAFLALHRSMCGHPALALL